MRALIIYLVFGAAFTYAEHALRFDTVLFWRDLLTWPIVALDRIVDLGWLLTQRGQDYVTLCFAAALLVYVLARFRWPFSRKHEDGGKARGPAL